MTRVGAVDCGTNSIRLLIADDDGRGGLTEIRRDMVIVRLGQGVDATGRLAPEAVERTRAALADYVESMGEHGVERVRMVATSATRDASNRDEFFAMTADLLGRVVPGAVAEVISGDEEARLSFRGAVGDLISTPLDQRGVPLDRRGASLDRRGASLDRRETLDRGETSRWSSEVETTFLVTDLGGGSTELVTSEAAFSADIGCVRLTEHALHSDPPTAAEIAAAEAFVAERLAPAFAAVPVERARTWVGVAGTLTTLAALHLGLTEYDSARIHLSRIPLADLERVCRDLIAMPCAQRAELGPMHPGRVDVIGGGALVTLALAAEFARRAGIDELVVSETDILDGIALGLLD
ncbi:MAG: Ppx/GppA phosphatase family protein [Gordonia sp. (in: high G+C Gram-positive bacteria)]|uniref:Ppx/GppA phosphatase family protein n=1 Tax=Gordonia sp. (in: high G+C Gram-positive bacteria) TaxID=84139 RepID=UPI0039E438F4